MIIATRNVCWGVKQGNSFTIPVLLPLTYAESWCIYLA